MFTANYALLSITIVSTITSIGSMKLLINYQYTIKMLQNIYFIFFVRIGSQAFSSISALRSVYWIGNMITYPTDIFSSSQNKIDYFSPTMYPTNPTLDPSNSPSFYPTKNPSIFPSMFPTSMIPSVVPTIIPTATPSVIPSVMPTQPSVMPTIVPTQTPSSIVPTVIPSSAPSRIPSSQKPSILPSLSPSKSPSSLPTVTPSLIPSYTPTVIPSIVPTSTSTLSPTDLPMVAQTLIPSPMPTKSPSMIPSFYPSVVPTAIPSMTTTLIPSQLPPSMIPSFYPSVVPTAIPSMTPTLIPSQLPTESPSMIPSFYPSVVPTAIPTMTPTLIPSPDPTESPSMIPSFYPSVVPTAIPTMTPTLIPSPDPTESPSTIQLRTIYPTKNLRIPTSSPTTQVSVWMKRLQELLSFASISSTLSSLAHQSLYYELDNLDSTYNIQKSSCSAWSNLISNDMRTAFYLYNPMTIQMTVQTNDSLDATTDYSSYTLQCHDYENVASMVKYLTDAQITSSFKIECEGHIWRARHCNSTQVVGRSFPALCIDCDDPCSPKAQCNNNLFGREDYVIAPCVPKLCDAATQIPTI